MDPGEFTQSQPIRCEGCRQTTPSYDIVNYGSMERGYRPLCSQCFNAEVAEAAGLEKFEHAKVRTGGSRRLRGGGPRVSLSHPPVRNGSSSRRLRTSRWLSGWLPFPDHRRTK